MLLIFFLESHKKMQYSWWHQVKGQVLFTHTASLPDNFRREPKYGPQTLSFFGSFVVTCPCVNPDAKYQMVHVWSSSVSCDHFWLVICGKPDRTEPNRTVRVPSFCAIRGLKCQYLFSQRRALVSPLQHIWRTTDPNIHTCGQCRLSCNLGELKHSRTDTEQWSSCSEGIAQTAAWC